MEYHSAVKQNKSLIHVTIWMELICVMLSEENETQMANPNVWFHLYDVLAEASYKDRN